MNKYEQQGQRLYSQNWSEEYKENYDKIFGKKETWLERREREKKECSTCKNYLHTRNKCGNASCIYEKEADDYILSGQ